MILFHLMKEEKRIRRQLAYVEHKVGRFPDTNLNCVQNGKYFKYYQTDGHHNHYIPKSNIQFAQQLAAKEYYLRLKQQHKHLLKLIDYYKRHVEKDQEKIQVLFENDSGYAPLLQPLFEVSHEYEEWAKAPFETNLFYPEGRKFKTKSGIYVRSKSEMMIANILQEHQVPFRYECGLELGNHTFYPDFTLKHPETGEIYYFEHFGMIDEPKYRSKMLDKLDVYLEYDVRNLIITTETKARPLTVEQVEHALICFEPFEQAS